MSFGFPAYSTNSRRFRLDQQQLIDLIGKALKYLGWPYQQPLPNRFLARTAFGFWSWGERLTVDVDADGTVTARSECLLATQCIDWGKNGRNVNAVLNYVAHAARACDTTPVATNAT